MHHSRGFLGLLFDLDISRLTVLPSSIGGEGKDGDSYPFRLCPSEVEILFGITVV